MYLFILRIYFVKNNQYNKSLFKDEKSYLVLTRRKKYNDYSLT